MDCECDHVYRNKRLSAEATKKQQQRTRRTHSSFSQTDSLPKKTKHSFSNENGINPFFSLPSITHPLTERNVLEREEDKQKKHEARVVRERKREREHHG